LDFLLYFDNEDKLEYTYTGSKFISSPLGTSIIDFFDIYDSGVFNEADFEEKYAENKNIANNPFLSLYKDSNGNMDFDRFKLEIANNLDLYSYIKALLIVIFTEDSATYSEPPYDKFNTQQRFYFAITHQNLMPDLSQTTFISRIVCLNENTLKNKTADSLEYELENPDKLSVKFCEIYKIDDIASAFYITLIKMAMNGIKIKNCNCCGKLFLFKDKSERYCDRLYQNDKTCKELGYIYKVRNDDLLSIYNTAYKTKHAEKQRKTKGKSKATCEAYKKAMKNWREEVKSLLTEAKASYDSTNDPKEKEIITNDFKHKLENKDLEV
jgi:hypothetical protein